MFDPTRYDPRDMVDLSFGVAVVLALTQALVPVLNLEWSKSFNRKIFLPSTFSNRIKTSLEIKDKILDPSIQLTK